MKVMTPSSQYYRSLSLTSSLVLSLPLANPVLLAKIIGSNTLTMAAHSEQCGSSNSARVGAVAVAIPIAGSPLAAAINGLVAILRGYRCEDFIISQVC